MWKLFRLHSPTERLFLGLDTSFDQRTLWPGMEQVGVVS